MPSRADFYDLLIVGTGLSLMLGASKLLPDGLLQTVLIILGFGLVIGDAILLELLFEWITMHYPYVKIKLPSSKKVLHVFLDKQPISEPRTKIINSTTLESHWPLELPYYGRFRKLVIEHELGFQDRVKFGPGYAMFQGYIINHPQVAEIICHEFTYSASDRYKAESIPAFMLAYAFGGDVDLVPTPLTSTFNALEDVLRKQPELVMNPTSINAILKGMKHYETMQFMYLEADRVAQFYRSECLRLEASEASKDSQTKALLASSNDSTEQAWEIVLDWTTIFGSMDRILKKLRKGPSLLFNKYTAMVFIAAIGAVTAGFLSLNKDAMAWLGNSLRQPSTQIVIVVLALALLGGAYFITKWRKRE